ncbi:Putative amidoligase enzyme [Colletotrichum destructivum]|uniref:Amidoligase enzyme n=1 Tax=Colletotrichum destructivum TaxID=34406 RepID=A0AAX4I2C9_9PEZI|nr:Putative amidoligase enzyme [Colletotrichum destructivum]
MSVRIHLEFVVRVDAAVSRQTKETTYKPEDPGAKISARLRKMGVPASNTLGDVDWFVHVDQGIIHLGKTTWRLAHVSSPFIPLDSRLTFTVASVCSALQTDNDLKIGLNHLPRLGVEIKPDNSVFTVIEAQRTLALLWSAGPRLSTLHAEYCGVGSAVAPGLEFSRLANTSKRFFLPPIDLPHEISLKRESKETMSNHGFSGKVQVWVPTQTRGTSLENHAIRSIKGGLSTMEDLVEGTRVYVKKSKDDEARVTRGAYDFTSLLQPDNHSIRFNQHGGTMNARAIVAWAEVCHTIVDFCKNAPQSLLQSLLERLSRPSVASSETAESASSRPYTVFDLLVDLRLPSQAAYYKSLGPNPFVPELTKRMSVDILEREGVQHQTFGVEIEYLVPYNRVEHPDARPDDRRWVYTHPAARVSPFNSAYSALGNRLARLLTGAGHLGVTFDSQFRSWGPTIPMGSKANIANIAQKMGYPLIRFVDDVDSIHQIWHIHSDPSLSNFQNGEFGYGGHVGVELSSPILRPTPGDFGKVIDVLQLIRASTRSMTDPTCGFHVHVGDVRGFSLRSMKKIATLVWAAEPVLYSLVHPSRSDFETAAPMSTQSALAEEDVLDKYDSDVSTAASTDMEAHLPMEVMPQRLQDMMLALWSAKNIPDILGLLQPGDDGHKGGLSFASMTRTYFGDSTEITSIYQGTVEFRQLEGTLDPELIMYWTKLVLRIAEVGRDMPAARFSAALSKIVKKYPTERERLSALLEVLGLEEHLTYWGRAVAKNKAQALATAPAKGSERKRYQLPDEVSQYGYDERNAFLRAFFEDNMVFVPETDETAFKNAKNLSL